MQELLITITFLSIVSSEEFELRKRLELPPEIDPNFWPVRGRRVNSDFENPSLFRNLIEDNERDRVQGSEIDYSGYSGVSKILRPWLEANKIFVDQEDLTFSDKWKSHSCPRKKPISLVLPVQNLYKPKYEQLRSYDGGYGRIPFRNCGRRGDETWRRQKPMYVDEPGWIEIDNNHGTSKVSSDEEPFIITRGKKRSDEREKREYLDDVAGKSYSVDPLFVTRGKRNAITDNREISKRPEELRYQLNLKKGEEKVMDFKRNPENRDLRKKIINTVRDFDDKKVLNSEKVGEKEFEKFSSDRPFVKSSEKKSLPINYRSKYEEADPNVVLTKGLNDDKLRYRRSDPLTPNEEGLPFDDGNNTKLKNSLRQVSASAFGSEDGTESRYSKPRDKHSNLQSILEEPFFVSRGKKKDGSKEYLYEGEDDLPIEKMPSDETQEILPSDIFRVYSGHKTRSLYYDGKDFGMQSNNADKLHDYETGLIEKSMYRNKRTKNRRGILDDILKSDDDPFYVTRGKKLFGKPNEEYNTGIAQKTLMDRDVNERKNHFKKNFSLFTKSMRTKLLSKLWDLKKANLRNVINGSI